MHFEYDHRTFSVVEPRRHIRITRSSRLFGIDHLIFDYEDRNHSFPFSVFEAYGGEAVALGSRRVERPAAIAAYVVERSIQLGLLAHGSLFPSDDRAIAVKTWRTIVWLDHRKYADMCQRIRLGVLALCTQGGTRRSAAPDFAVHLVPAYGDVPNSAMRPSTRRLYARP